MGRRFVRLFAPPAERAIRRWRRYVVERPAEWSMARGRTFGLPEFHLRIVFEEDLSDHIGRTGTHRCTNGGAAIDDVASARGSRCARAGGWMRLPRDPSIGPAGLSISREAMFLRVSSIASARPARPAPTMRTSVAAGFMACVLPSVIDTRLCPNAVGESCCRGYRTPRFHHSCAGRNVEKDQPSTSPRRTFPQDAGTGPPVPPGVPNRRAKAAEDRCRI